MVATQLPAMPARPDPLRVNKATQRSEAHRPHPTDDPFDRVLDRAKDRVAPTKDEHDAKKSALQKDECTSDPEEIAACGTSADDIDGVADSEGSDDARGQALDAPALASVINPEAPAKNSAVSSTAASDGAANVVLPAQEPQPELLESGMVAISLPGGTLHAETLALAESEAIPKPTANQMPSSTGIDLAVLSTTTAAGSKQSLATGDAAAAALTTSHPETAPLTVPPARGTDTAAPLQPSPQALPTPGIASPSEPSPSAFAPADASRAASSADIKNTPGLVERSADVGPAKSPAPSPAEGVPAGGMAIDGGALATADGTSPDPEVATQTTSPAGGTVQPSALEGSPAASQSEADNQSANVLPPPVASEPTTDTETEADANKGGVNPGSTPVAAAASPGAETPGQNAFATAVAQASPANASGSTPPTQTASPGQLPAVVLSQVEDMAQGSEAQRRLIVRLDPPELGRVTLELIHRGDEVLISARADTQEAVKALMRQREALQTVLETMGMSLSEFDVKSDGEEQTQHGNRNQRSGQKTTTSGRFGQFGDDDPVDLHNNQGALFL